MYVRQYMLIDMFAIKYATSVPHWGVDTSVAALIGGSCELIRSSTNPASNYTQHPGCVTVDICDK